MVYGLVDGKRDWDVKVMRKDTALQYVVMCCSVLQIIAVRGSAVHCVAECDSMLQSVVLCVVAGCSGLQCGVVYIAVCVAV